jgi:hypothetical protein
VFTLEDAVYVATETNYLRRVEVESLETREKVRPDLIVHYGAGWYRRCHLALIHADTVTFRT